jgi:hypothetical protein
MYLVGASALPAEPIPRARGEPRTGAAIAAHRSAIALPARVLAPSLLGNNCG